MTIKQWWHVFVHVQASTYIVCIYMLCTLAFVEARHSFIMHAVYIDTPANHLADDLSRNSLSSFLKVPQADAQPTPRTHRVLSPVPGPSRGLDLSALAPVVQQYFQAGLAPFTQRTYDSGLRRFYAFCTKYNVWNPFPVTEHSLCCFAAYLANDGLVAPTVKSYLSAVRSMQISLGFPDPTDQSSLPILKRIQAGINRIRGTLGQTARITVPITAPLLRQVRGVLESSNHPERVVIWAICTTAFFGFFRLGELLLTKASDFCPHLHLAWGDVAVDSNENPTMIQINLRCFKTDQFGRGASIVLGRTEVDLCPVAAILSYLAVRGGTTRTAVLNNIQGTGHEAVL